MPIQLTLADPDPGAVARKAGGAHDLPVATALQAAVDHESILGHFAFANVAVDRRIIVPDLVPGFTRIIFVAGQIDGCGAREVGRG
jgi:hypothetical protein